MEKENKELKELAMFLHKKSNFDFDCNGDCEYCWCKEKTTAMELIELGYKKVEI